MKSTASNGSRQRRLVELPFVGRSVTRSAVPSCCPCGGGHDHRAGVVVRLPVPAPAKRRAAAAAKAHARRRLLSLLMMAFISSAFISAGLVLHQERQLLEQEKAARGH